MKYLDIGRYRFMTEEVGKAVFVFSTAEGGLNFNKSLEEGQDNINNIKAWFNVEEVGYCNQIHSGKVLAFNENNADGDALITDKVKTALGVFTADCVPVLLYDRRNNIIAAVHSGWRGTAKEIVINTIVKMKNDFNSEANDIIAMIGPHNRQCCYEVGNEVIDEFRKLQYVKDLKFVKERNISLEAIIEKQLIIQGIKAENIYKSDLCTYCSDEVGLHSYRKGKNNYGRMFSFVFLKA